MGFESLLLPLSDFIILRAIKNSVFKIPTFTTNVRFNIMRIWYFLLSFVYVVSCGASNESEVKELTQNNAEDSVVVEQPLYCNADVTVGAERFDEYLDDLKGKRVALVGNQSSRIGETHLVDTLLAQGVNLVKVFSPEHGFRGDADAGEKVKDGVDPVSGLPVISLYGKNKKPKEAQLADVDVILFDIQDVGARFYTYISTMHYVLESAAENNKKIIILDRPNPNGHYVDGPVLKDGYTSFVGMHPGVPVVHGMTIGEYAKMLVGEGWLSGGVKPDMKVVEILGWDHTKFYELPVAPSPNLPNMKAVYWYPTLCFFEGTVVSIGRGTDLPFQCVGHPDYEVDVLEDLYSFTPAPNDGAKNPKLNGETCYGYDLSRPDVKEIREKRQLDLFYLVDFYEDLGSEKSFFLDTDFINLLAGSSSLKNAVLSGKSPDEIRDSWQDDLTTFKEIRKKYLLYTDFE